MSRFDNLFALDPNDGVLYWKYRGDRGQRWNTRWAGKQAGGVNPSDGYIYVQVDGRLITASRICWCIYYGCELHECPQIVDHKDGVRTNNRKHNLRAATYSQNNHNEALKANNTSGHKGVSIRKNAKRMRYRASICIDYKQHEASFETIEEAIQWRERMASKLHKEFACGNKHTEDKEVGDVSV